MFTGKLRRSGNDVVVTIPRHEVERLGLTEGQLVTIDLYPAESGPVLAADLRDAFEIELRHGREALDHLAQN